jgi:protein TonB
LADSEARPVASPASDAALSDDRDQAKARSAETTALSEANAPPLATPGLLTPGNSAPARQRPASTLGDDVQEGLGAVPSASTPTRLTPDMTPPVLLERNEPEYPLAARRARIEGEVILECIINERGSVQVSRILKSVPELDAAATDAVRRWTYRPAFLEGRPQAVYLMIRIAFELP